MTGGLPRRSPDRIEATPQLAPTFALAFDGPTAKVCTLTESGLQ